MKTFHVKPASSQASSLTATSFAQTTRRIVWRSVATFAALSCVFFLCGIMPRALAFLNTSTQAKANQVDPGAMGLVLYENGKEINACTPVTFCEQDKKITLGVPAGKAAGVVRVSLTPNYLSATSAPGDRHFQAFDMRALAAPVNNKMVLGDFTLHFAANWSTNWIYKDGFFYYNKVLKPGETTPVLLSGISVAAGKESLYSNKTYLSIAADSIQPAPAAVPAQWGVVVGPDGSVTIG
ncbi:MAG: hypothetical protein RR866_03300 [Raoultibacter sp.]